MKRPWVLLLAIVLCAGLIGGCATANLVQDARTQVAKAKNAGADWSAPYEYYAAEAYLLKAEKSAEIGDTKQAAAFANQSKDYSAKAIASVGGGK
jgi:hypothetical protein